MNTLKRNSFFVFLAILFFSCSSAIFNQRSYDNAVELKTQSLELMSSATENYSLHENAVKSLDSSLKKTIINERKRPNNEETANMYKLLADPNGNLLGAFLKQWKSSGTLSPAFVSQFRGQISSAFDKIIDLESAKKGS